MVVAKGINPQITPEVIEEVKQATAEVAEKAPFLISRAYTGYLELPVVIVLMTMWLAGVALIGALVMWLYLYWELLLTFAT
jgi:hypothetical protein